MGYRHTQIGWTITIVMLAILAFLLLAAHGVGSLGVIGWALLIFFGVLTILFCTLNARVDDETLLVSFGRGSSGDGCRSRTSSRRRCTDSHGGR